MTTIAAAAAVASLFAAALLAVAAAAEDGAPATEPSAVATTVRPDKRYSDCGSTWELLDAHVEGCDWPPCMVKRGSNVSVTIDFRAKGSDAGAGEGATDLRPEVLGVLNDLEVPLVELDHTDACERLSRGRCPLADGEEAQYSAVFPLDPDFPKIKGEVRWLLTDSTNATVVCVSVSAEAV